MFPFESVLDDNSKQPIQWKPHPPHAKAVVIEEEEEIKPRSKVRTVALVTLVALIAFAGMGSLGALSGAGFFSHRTFLYGTGELYVLNMNETPLWISVDGRERAEVPALNAKIVELIGGTSEVVATDAAGQIKGRYTIEAKNSDAFLKLSDDQCLAAVKLDSFYRGGGKQDIEFAALLSEKTRIWVPESHNVVWPRKAFPKSLSAEDGPGIWLELVGCPLLEDPKFLDAYIAVRLEDRVNKARGTEPKK